MDDDTPSLAAAWPVLGALVLLALLLGGALVLGRGEPEAPPPGEGYALDLADPWPLRDALPPGTSGLREDLASLPEPWAQARPLFVTRHDGALEVVLLDADRRRWAVATRRAEWSFDTHVLPDRPVAMLVARAGRGGSARLLVVAAPHVRRVQRVAGDGAAYGEDLREVAEGVAEGPLLSQSGSDDGSLLALDGDDVVASEPVPAG